MQKTHWHASKMRQLWQNPPSQFYRLSFTSTTQPFTSAATAPPKANNTCFLVQASSLSNSQATEVSTLTV
jgi:hypothetical protein